MKRERLSIKQKIAKKIETRHQNLVFIDKKGNRAMNERDKLRIYGLPKPDVVEKHHPLSLSVLVTAYQTQDYIEECLDSIENQTYFKNNNDFEILVGVDACQETLNKLLEIRHKYRNLSIFMMGSNMGTYVTTNTLLDLVNFENIIRFDSDDVMRPEMINTILQNVCNYNLIRFKYYQLRNNIIENVAHGIYPHGVAYFKRQLFNDLGGYQPWMCAADTELLSRGKSIIRELLLNIALFNRRMHSNSLTASQEFGHKSEIRINYRKAIINQMHNKIKINRETNKYVRY